METHNEIKSADGLCAAIASEAKSLHNVKNGKVDEQAFETWWAIGKIIVDNKTVISDKKDCYEFLSERLRESCETEISAEYLRLMSVLYTFFPLWDMALDRFRRTQAVRNKNKQKP